MYYPGKNQVVSRQAGSRRSVEIRTIHKATQHNTSMTRNDDNDDVTGTGLCFCCICIGEVCSMCVYVHTWEPNNVTSLQNSQSSGDAILILIIELILVFEFNEFV